jgi:hypothetical protein
MMQWRNTVATFLIALALTGCAQETNGRAGTPYTPYQQDNPRDITGMH